jgi:hypothetical protein
MRLPILSRGLGACVLLASVALAQNSGTSDGGSTQSLPVGQTFKQFTFPVYGPDGQLHYSFFAVAATGVTINRAEADTLTIDVYDNGQKTTTITSPKADLYVSERKMRTTNTVRIERADMEATSQDCDFSATTKKYILRTNVKVLLKHFDVGKSSPGTSTNAPVKPLPPLHDAAAALPAPDTSNPTPTDESILPSPGAYSEKPDKNSAPLPPANTPAQ